MEGIAVINSRPPQLVELDLRVVVRRVVVQTPNTGPQARDERDEATGSLLLAARDAARRSPQ